MIMKKITLFLMLFTIAGIVKADVSISFDNVSDTTGWYQDRYPSAVFESGVNANGRTGVLKQGVTSGDNQANRPGAFSGDFYNYQGYKYDTNLTGVGSFASIDLFTDSTWSAGTRAGFWTTMNNGNLSYPIIEFAVNADNSGYGGSSNFTGFRWWQSGIGWTDGIAMTADDQWHSLNIELGANDVFFYIDDNLLATVDNHGAEGIQNIILNVHNQGPAGDYDVYWDNFKAATVPAPGAMLLAGIGTACVGRIRRRVM